MVAEVRAVVVENISFWRRRLLFKRLSSWVWKCLRVCFVPPPPTKKAIAKKNLEADNENFSFPFYDLMGPPCVAHSVNAAKQRCQRSDMCIVLDNTGLVWKLRGRKTLTHWTLLLSFWPFAFVFALLNLQLQSCINTLVLTATELCVYYHIIVSRVKQGQECWSTKNKQR